MFFLQKFQSKKKSGFKSQFAPAEKKFYKKKWFLFTSAAVFFLLLAGGVLAFRAGLILNKVSEADESMFSSLFNVLPVVGKDELEEDDGRINVALLGMRGENVPGGGLLADSIIVLSLNTKENKVAMISVPRDLYVKIPNGANYSKINAVHAIGEQQEKGGGLKAMEQILGEITGQKIHYAVAINFYGFKQLIDAVGGVEINLETPFYETHQFVEGKECGLEFTLPKGKNILNGEKALCYARARDNTSDFDRAKRQQVILMALKDKLVSMGTLTDFGKLNAILNAIGDNVRTDMASFEMKNFYEQYAGMQDAQIYRRVFENSEEGLLTVPADSHGAGYILIPRAGQDNYTQTSEVCTNIFNLPPQSDINPQKQYSKPAATDINEVEVKTKKKSGKKKDSSESKDEDAKDATDKN